MSAAAAGPTGSGFALAVDEGTDLVLREAWTVDHLLPVVRANLEHLRAWEPWAAGEQTAATMTSYGRDRLQEWLDGRAVPTAVRHDGRLVGSVGARLDTWHGSAELGYWIDAGHQGRGLVHRCASALVDHLVHDRGVERVEVRTVAGNRRSRAVAERLGLALEGTLEAATTVHGRRHDVVVYGLPAARWRAR